MMLAILTSPALAAISYTVGGWGPTQFPGPVTPPTNAPWGVNGYPGDTVEFQGYTGSLDLAPGTYIKPISSLLWTIDYTYAGTATNPTDWSDLTFLFNAVRSISFEGGATGNLTQPGTLEVTWDNDFLSLGKGLTVSLQVQGYQVDVTPLALNKVGGSNFSGGNPWVQPARDVYAEFVVTESPVPEPTAIIVWSLLGAIGIGVICRRRRRAT